MCKQISSPEKEVGPVSRSRTLDLLCFLVPLMFCGVTDVVPIYLTGILRILSTHLFLSLHYVFVDKDNYDTKLSQKQIMREKGDYLVGIILHMWAQVGLQLLFPSMFFVDSSLIPYSFRNTLLAHVAVVEPLYYAVHRWLHTPKHMRAMHGFHHMSVSTLPSSSLVQNFKEHFIYIATFGPAMLLPYFLVGFQHWTIIMGYLIVFDIVNAYGHTNIRCRHWIWDSKWSPLRYLFYTPEFHLGHHHYYNFNFGLFMPLWDHLFSTYKEYQKPPSTLLPAQKQDFVFIGHNGGLGHFLTCPEYSMYNIYDSYRSTGLPIEFEMVIANVITIMSRLIASSYIVSRYLVKGEYIGRIICLMRSPIDYAHKSRYGAINNEIVALIKEQFKKKGTRFFGLGNLNKMKQLNDGGQEIARLVKEDSFLVDKNIHIWTGDTLTSASVYHQLVSIPDLTKVFYIGANGKIGNAVCELLAKRNIQIRIFSTHVGITHPNISYTQDLTEIRGYKYVVIGKFLNRKVYKKALKSVDVDSMYLLDYTVPFLPIPAAREVQHIQIGVLHVKSNEFLRGYYDICMGTDQNHIYPCHAGCILNMVLGRTEDEVGEINVNEIEPLWASALKFGLENKVLNFD